MPQRSEVFGGPRPRLRPKRSACGLAGLRWGRGPPKITQGDTRERSGPGGIKEADQEKASAWAGGTGPRWGQMRVSKGAKSS